MLFRVSSKLCTIFPILFTIALFSEKHDLNIDMLICLLPVASWQPCTSRPPHGVVAMDMDQGEREPALGQRYKQLVPPAVEGRRGSLLVVARGHEGGQLGDLFICVIFRDFTLSGFQPTAVLHEYNALQNITFYGGILSLIKRYLFSLRSLD